ncbi:MAG TPA: ABC-F family ATP-binding cassette domain-containing protein [Acidimicrobiales bacterium]|nr:ABC-F family ATP-binding cassette domain-containing protein [Acidimicrobiales bacterium]
MESPFMPPARPLATLLATGLTRAHGTFVVLDGVDLTIGPRSRIGVVGPNGVGKSTLLRILAGLEPSDNGRIVAAPPDLTVGYLPQEPQARAGETLSAYLGRRTGVAAAEAELERAATGLAPHVDVGPPPDGDLPAVRAPDPEDRYSAALDRYLALGGPDFESRAEAVCADLGLPTDRLAVEMAQLSGGQAARAALAAILLSRFDILLLDEPTNDLDFAGLARLERFLHESDGGLVVVSHDRAFLEATVARVLELDEHDGTATEYGGGWLGYLDAKTVARGHAEEAHERYTSQRDDLVERARIQRQWAVLGVRNVKQKATDHDKAQQGFKVNRTEKQAAKVRQTETALARLEVVEKPWEGWDLHLELAPSSRSGDIVARLAGAVVERGTFVLGPVDLEVRWAERVAITGPNGSGKTTLLRALLGQLPLAAGDRYLGPGVVVGELDQGRRRFLTDEPLVTTFAASSGLLVQASRSLLAKFGLSGEHVDRPGASLSPGERTRAVLALMMAGGANCLVLDEPTNHLDLPAIEQLEQALDGYDGTLLLVSHDRRLLEAVRTTRTVDVEQWRRR